MNTKKRTRAPNYTASESIDLCNIIEKYKHIIENKKTDGATLKEKQQAWLKVAEEYNSSTMGYHRTLDSLQLNYRNIKKKTKKELSAKKMAIPVDKELLIETITCFGDDWTKVSDAVGASETECFDTFNDLKILGKTHEKENKNKILGTGGGPSNIKEDALLEKVCSLVGPAMDGLYTMYDGDSIFMSSQKDSTEQPIEVVNFKNNTAQKDSTEQPIEMVNSKNNRAQKDSTEQPIEVVNFENNRANLKRKRNPKLIVPKQRKCETNQPSVSSKFKVLAEEKMELVQLQKQLVLTQIKAEEQRIKNLKLENDILSLQLQQDDKSL